MVVIIIAIVTNAYLKEIVVIEIGIIGVVKIIIMIVVAIMEMKIIVIEGVVDFYQIFVNVSDFKII